MKRMPSTKNTILIALFTLLTMIMFFLLTSHSECAFAESDLSNNYQELANNSENLSTMADNDLPEESFLEIEERSNYSGDTTVCGTVRWQAENGNYYAFRKSMIKVCSRTPSNTTQIIGTTYTNDNGYYSLVFTYNSSITYNLYIRAYAGDDDTYVLKSDNSTRYYAYTTWGSYTNITLGSTTTINYDIPYTHANIKAFYISQALLTGKKFVTEMSSTPDGVKAVLSSTDGTYYDIDNATIFIKDDDNVDYRDWDVILHEYGHHISYWLNIVSEIGGWHSYDINMSDHYSLTSSTACDSSCARHGSNATVSSLTAKEYGNKIAWSEGWATAFGELTQQYSSSSFPGLVNFSDGLYTDSFLMSDGINYGNNVIFNYSSECQYLGEGCESSIIGVLWSLYNNNYYSFSFQQWWDMTTENNPSKNFSGFIQNFYSLYPNKKGKIGYLLSLYKMAPSITMTGTITELKPNMSTSATISWTGNNGSTYFPNNVFSLIVFDPDWNIIYTQNLNSSLSYIINSSLFDAIKTYPGSYVNISIAGSSTSSPSTGSYVSNYQEINKREFIISPITGTNNCVVTGAYCSFTGIMTIPATIDGKTVVKVANNAFENSNLTTLLFEEPTNLTSIGSSAFFNCSNLDLLVIPPNLTEIEFNTFAYCGNPTHIYEGNSLTTIGSGAFWDTKLVSMKEMFPTVTTIESTAFGRTTYGRGFHSDFSLVSKNTLQSIGSHAFCNNRFSVALLSNATTTIGSNAFSGNTDLTIYTQHSSKPAGWNTNWNIDNRPVFWGCALSSTKDYVISFVKSATNPSNASAINGIKNPVRSGYSFGGWYTTSNFTGTQYMDVTLAPNGTLYAKWTSNSSCIAAGSMITLADGTQKAVEELTGNESLLVWNLYTGTFDYAPIVFIDSDPLRLYEIIRLTFADGTTVDVIDEHGFFDVSLGEYVYLRRDASQYVGHYFNKCNGNTWTTVQLTGVTISEEYTTAWSPVTYGHLCYYVNGMLSMPGGITGLFNIFEVDASLMAYDAASMATDIATYGVYTYAEFNALITVSQDVFDAFNGPYLKVAVGKGLLTLDDIRALVDRYSGYLESI